MSKLKVNEIDSKTGTTITVAAGKTLAGTDIIGSTQIAANAVDTSEIAAGAVEEAKIDDNAVTLAKMAGLVRGKIIVGDASGDPSALTVGTADQVLQSDGTDAAWADLSTGTAWQAVKTASFTAVAGNGYPCNTTSATFTATLPAAASVGDTIEFMDYSRTWGSNALTLNQNSLNYQSNTSPNPVYDTTGESLRIVYVDATQGWVPVFDGAVVFETLQNYNIESLCIGGGGGAGGSLAGYTSGGGGGAGGYRNSYASEASGGGGSTEAVFNTDEGVVYTITVGPGGTGGIATSAAATVGADTSISGSGLTTITSAGGGGGGTATNESGLNATAGGSGGGAQYYNSDSAKAGTANQGYAGGASGPSSGSSGSGGGGGAAAVGGAGTASLAGVGGVGLDNTITGASVGRGGGGGGGQYALPQNQATNPAVTATHGGGLGGLGANDGNAGTVNTGGGGGGGSATSGYPNVVGGAGGSGVVILRMGTTYYTGTITGSPTVTTDSSDTIIVFTGDGTYTS